jgi:putative ABC transport system ATP-binding protein
MIEITSLEKTFEQPGGDVVPALRGVSLTIPAGQFLTVIGSNGSGKSTILNVIAGTYLTDSGTIRIGDVDVTRWPEHRRAAHVGRVFQDPFKGTCPSMTVAENLRMAELRGKRRGLRIGLDRASLERYREALASLGMRLEGRLQASMGTLSGGQRQAVTLLMATLTRPDLLLLDEHTAALDPRSTEQVVQLTEEIIRKEGLTTLMVTHSMQQAVALGDRVVLMHRGRIVETIGGARKRQLRVEELLDSFDRLRSADTVDESTADMLRRLYI